MPAPTAPIRRALNARGRSLLVLLSVLMGVAVAVGGHFVWLAPGTGSEDSAVALPGEHRGDDRGDASLRRGEAEADTSPSAAEGDSGSTGSSGTDSSGSRDGADGGDGGPESSGRSSVPAPGQGDTATGTGPNEPQQPAAPEDARGDTGDSAIPTRPGQPPEHGETQPTDRPPESSGPSEPPEPSGPPADEESEPTAPPSSEDPDRTDSPTSELASEINREREAAGCAPARVAPSLTSSAQDHSDDMAANRMLSHESSDGTSFDDRVEGHGYSDPAAENVAMGLSSAEAVLGSWMSSHRHRTNILDCEVTAMGAGVNSDGWYWTLDFGY